MKTVDSLLFGISSSVGACIIAAGVASYVVASPEGQSTGSLSAADLWTSNPVRVDPTKQNLERLPALLSSYATATTTASRPTRLATVDAPPPKNEPVSQISEEHLTWCSSRYRSFDPATNSYRSYSGELKTCSSPYDQVAMQPNEPNQPAEIEAEAAAWCASRYRSYRQQDNTYRTYDGERRVCEPPGQVRDLVASRD